MGNFKLLKIILIITFFILFKFSVLSQKSNPIILDEPKDWLYEKIEFPLSFAPNILYKGFEELRFAPGMFNKSESMYFTYIFAVSINDKISFTEIEIRDFLYKYYKGLCASVAKQKNFSIDTSKIKVVLKKSVNRKNRHQIFRASVNFFDVFSDGDLVLLNMELEVIIDRKNKKTYILSLVSPKSKQSKVWRERYMFRDKIKSGNSILMKLVNKEVYHE